MSPIQRARRKLDNWRLWMVIAYVGLAACIVFLYALQRNQAQADAERAAARESQAATEVSRCLQQVTSAPQVARVLRVIDLVVTNSILANEAALEADPDSDLTPVRQASLARLRPGRVELRKFIEATEEAAPTMKDCRELAVSLGIDPPR